eukprot:c14393_g1_i1.p1 GENE.c14393_g1_i1~~c14393_g1_i1.p1  ORF type:complete len:287 (+),score=77.55 c14393_g1_i1:35-862(+)
MLVFVFASLLLQGSFDLDAKAKQIFTEAQTEIAKARKESLTKPNPQIAFQDKVNQIIADAKSKAHKLANSNTPAVPPPPKVQGAAIVGKIPDDVLTLRDDITVCTTPGMDQCPVFQKPLSPLSAHPFCGCEERVQMQDIERTRYLDYYFNRFTALRKCKGSQCADCISILTELIPDLSFALPKSPARWCATALPSTPDCVPMVRGFKLASDGIRSFIAAAYHADSTKPPIEAQTAGSDAQEGAPPPPGCEKDEACIMGVVKKAIKGICRQMDCCY